MSDAYRVITARGHEIYPYRRQRLSTVVGRAEDYAKWSDDHVQVVDESGRIVWDSRRAL